MCLTTASEGKIESTEKEFEAQFEKQNVLTGKHEIRLTYVMAESVEDAKAELCWIHGDVIDIQHVREFRG